MILQALNELYARIPGSPEYVYATKPVSFTFVLDRNGALVDVQDERSAEGKRPAPKRLDVPDILQRRSVKIMPNLACDNSAYVLGRDDKENPERARLCFESFKALHARLAQDVPQPATTAVAAFLATWDPARTDELKYKEDLVGGANICFRLSGTREYLHDAPGVAAWWRSYVGSQKAGVVGQCLISGLQQPIAKLHPPVKGVRDAQTMGAGIVSFNLEAFESYGKEQNLNAPVGEEAAFRYAVALNHLLARDSRRRIQIGDATTVFWTEKPEPIEDVFGLLIHPPEDADQNARLIALLHAVRAGLHPPEMGNPSTKFYILGLSPNGPRLAVRFWLVSSVEEIAQRVARHFEDLRIIPQWPSDRPYSPLWLLLKQTAVQGKDENIPPTLAGAAMRSILTGTLYPRMLLQAVVRRIRAEEGDVSYLRVSLIKACLNRQFRNEGNREEVPVSLDMNRKEPAYRLGRLFAVLEKVQADALGDPNATITDRFYAAASATPAVVFPRLVRLSQHHLAKLEGGLRVVREKLVQEIADALDGFPPHLGLEDQGLFAIGYYHQKKDLYTKKEAKGA